MDPTQFYETAIYNREATQAFRFVTVPTRALQEREAPDVMELAQALGLRLDGPRGPGPGRIEPVEGWSLPFLVDAALGRFPGFPYEFEFYFDPQEPMRPRRGPSQFAQYVTYAPVIPFESSPLSGKSLAELATTGGGSVGAAIGFAQTGDLIVLLIVPAGIIVCGAARGVGEALRIGLRSKLLARMGVDDPELPAEAEEE